MCGSAPVSWSSFREYGAPAGYSWGRPFQVVANASIQVADNLNDADVSSAASEIHGAGTCVCDVLALS